MKAERADYLEAARAARALAEHTIRGAETELDGALKTACAALQKLPREPMDELLLGLLGPFALAVLAETLEQVAHHETAAVRCNRCGGEATPGTVTANTWACTSCGAFFRKVERP